MPKQYLARVTQQKMIYQIIFSLGDMQTSNEMTITRFFNLTYSLKLQNIRKDILLFVLGPWPTISKKERTYPLVLQRTLPFNLRFCQIIFSKLNYAIVPYKKSKKKKKDEL